MFNLDDTLSKEKTLNYNPIVLAFIGDAVYTLYVREKLVFNSDSKTGELNKKCTESVNAKSQAQLVDKISPYLNEEEIAVYKRAKNAKKPTKSKSCTPQEYNKSTGFEAIIGYLYMTGEKDRINYLLNLGENQ